MAARLRSKKPEECAAPFGKIDGLPAREAFLLGQVLRYADRAGEKDDPAIDLGKANNYAWRLVTGDWRADGGR